LGSGGRDLPVAAGCGRDDGGAVAAADELGVGAHGAWHDARLRAEGDAVHHARLGADALTVAAVVDLLAHFVALAVEGAEDLVALPGGAALPVLFALARVAAVDGRHNGLAHGVALEVAVLADALPDAAVIEDVTIQVFHSVHDAAALTVPTLGPVWLPRHEAGPGSWNWPAPWRANLAGLPVHVDADLPTAWRPQSARVSADVHAYSAAARRSEDARSSIVCDADAGALPAAGRSQDAGMSVDVDAGAVTTLRPDQAGAPVVRDTDLPAAARAKDAESPLVVDADLATAGRADDAGPAVVGDADLEATVGHVLPGNAALPLWAAVCGVFAEGHWELLRLLAAARGRGAGVLTRGALGEKGAVSSLGKLPRVDEEPRRRLAGVGARSRGVIVTTVRLDAPLRLVAGVPPPLIGEATPAGLWVRVAGFAQRPSHLK
jgi:hypothetical protein